ncbi:MAG: HDIG domain-containing protein [Acidobacteria bacterium]|jgi:putative nucleotidyltransferase with HDIG domain|nr:MAG: HDIG domain-containing protein [Acidobacteriota bacterium]GIU82423.1 MAG: phosphohydrolase [Pyrinomonadaceae bacterium]
MKAVTTLKEEIVEAIPELNLIEDTDLRNKTIAVWEDAITKGGWTVKRIKEIPFSVHVENCQITFIEHVRTVCKMCVAIADVLKEAYGDRIKLNKDYLIAGALLADVGKLIEYEERNGEITRAGRGKHLRHPFVGVAMSYARNIPLEVLHIIATHSKEGDIMVRSSESVIFHHADFIDFDLVSKKRPF